ncbi:silent information regulator family protein [Pelomyxa schiedti]|nr:silent information regulator family protein [Pelomyxa schiedti]
MSSESPTATVTAVQETHVTEPAPDNAPPTTTTELAVTSVVTTTPSSASVVTESPEPNGSPLVPSSSLAAPPPPTITTTPTATAATSTASSVPSSASAASTSATTTTTTTTTSSPNAVTPAAEVATSAAVPRTPGAFAAVPKRVTVFEETEGSLVRIGRCSSNDVVLITNTVGGNFTIVQNQRMSMVLCTGLRKCKVSILDSAVVTSRTMRIVDCSECEFIVEDVDVRKIECFLTTNCRFVIIGDEAVLENARILWREGCAGNQVIRGEMKNTEMSSFISYNTLVSLEVPLSIASKQYCTSFHPVQYIHNVEIVSQNSDGVATITREGLQIASELEPFTLPCLPDDKKLNAPSVIPSSVEIVQSLTDLREIPFTLTDDDLKAAYDLERVEYEDPEEVLLAKVKEVAAALRSAKHVVLYSGAGISTSGGIPDFRGPQGAWTMRDKGKFVVGKDLTGASPTFAHYTVTELVRRHFVHFVVTTNMDGLHLRSGLPQHLLVELHGCSYKEFCEGCEKFWLRSFDVLDEYHGRSHYTGRKCKWCGGKLKDTIVHFSDTYRSQMDPITALYHARKADVALVMGTSMNVQGAASYPDKALRNPNGKLIIVNLQYTPYDSLASTRVFARTDVFMNALAQELGIGEFDRTTDMVDTWDDEDDANPELPDAPSATNGTPSSVMAFLKRAMPSLF